MEGWIKLYRQFLNWEWYKDIPTKTVFIHLLIKANNEEAKWKGMTILRGQLFTSMLHICEETGLTYKQVRIAISKLESTKEVATKGANKGTMITICKYDDYQQKDKTKGRTKRQSKGDKQEEEEYIDNKLSILWRDDFEVYLKECKIAYKKYYNDKNFIEEQSRLNPNVNVKLSIEKGFTNYWGKEAGWVHKKKSRTKDIDWEATIINSISLNKVYYTKQELAAL